MAAVFSLDGHHLDQATDAVLHAGKEAVVSVSEDKCAAVWALWGRGHGRDSPRWAGADRTLMVWLKRDNGTFWPSVSLPLGSAGSALHFAEADRRLFVGTDLGAISVRE